MQEELAMDMRLLQEILKKTSNEDLERQQRKVIIQIPPPINTLLSMNPFHVYII